MLIGFCVVLLGVLVLLYPQILVAMLSGLLIMVGLGIMAASWQFRRLRKQSASHVMNWIARW